MEPNWPEQTLEHNTAQSSAEIPLRLMGALTFGSIKPSLEPKNTASWWITWKTWPCISMGPRCSWICFHHLTAILFTLIVCGPLGSPRCNMLHFLVITGFGRLDWNPTAHFLGLAPIIAVIKKQSQGRNHCVFGVNPDRRVHPGILIYGDCWAVTLPAVSVDLVVDVFLSGSLQETG